MTYKITISYENEEVNWGVTTTVSREMLSQHKNPPHLLLRGIEHALFTALSSSHNGDGSIGLLEGVIYNMLKASEARTSEADNYE